MRLWNVILPSWDLLLEDDFLDKRHSATSHLDGLRGFAAFIVFLSHNASPWYLQMRSGYEPGKMDTILQLPLIRILFHGTPMVVIFFVISGFVLSLKSIRLARVGMWEDYINTTSSIIFRRALRLFLPCLISTFIAAMFVQAGAYKFPYDYKLPGEGLVKPERLPVMVDQLVDWGHVISLNLINPWVSKGPITYNAPLWSIPVEFGSSMRLFVTMVGLCQLYNSARLCITIMLFTICMLYSRYMDAAILGGMFLAELRLIKANMSISYVPLTRRVIVCLQDIAANISVFLGLFIVSYPEKMAEVSPGYSWLFAVNSQFYFWAVVGAIFIVWGVDNSSLAATILNSRLLQYLGRISYSLYIVHYPILCVLIFPLQATLWGPMIEKESFFFSWQYYIVLLPGALLVSWVADIYYRYVDLPCVRFSHWVAHRLH